MTNAYYSGRMAHFIRALTMELVSPNKLAEVVHDVARYGKNVPDDFTKREQELAQLLGYSSEELSTLLTESYNAAMADCAATKKRNKELRNRLYISESQLKEERSRLDDLRKFSDQLLDADSTEHLDATDITERAPRYHLGQTVKKHRFVTNETVVIAVFLTESGFEYNVRDGVVTGFDPGERIPEAELEAVERRKDRDE
jgi:hypothetical protein